MSDQNQHIKQSEQEGEEKPQKSLPPRPISTTVSILTLPSGPLAYVGDPLGGVLNKGLSPVGSVVNTVTKPVTNTVGSMTRPVIGPVLGEKQEESRCDPGATIRTATSVRRIALGGRCRLETTLWDWIRLDDGDSGSRKRCACILGVEEGYNERCGVLYEQIWKFGQYNTWKLHLTMPTI